jgi:hypothetical protein
LLVPVLLLRRVRLWLLLLRIEALPRSGLRLAL